jgi:hypothetical protein
VRYLDEPEITAPRKDHLQPLNNAESVSLVLGEAVQLTLTVTGTLPRYRSLIIDRFLAPLARFKPFAEAKS